MSKYEKTKDGLVKDTETGATGIFRTVGGRRIFIKDGQDLASAMKESGKFKNKTDEQIKKVEKLENKKDELENKINNLNYEELNEIFNKTQDPDTREILMNKMQEKDVVRFGKEIYGIEMKDIDYKGSFDDAVKYDTLLFDEVLTKNLGVMDSTAASMCRDNRIPVLVFDLGRPDNIVDAVLGENVGTVVTA